MARDVRPKKCLRTPKCQMCNIKYNVRWWNCAPRLWIEQIFFGLDCVYLSVRNIVSGRQHLNNIIYTKNTRDFKIEGGERLDVFVIISFFWLIDSNLK